MNYNSPADHPIYKDSRAIGQKVDISAGFHPLLLVFPIAKRHMTGKCSWCSRQPWISRVCYTITHKALEDLRIPMNSMSAKLHPRSSGLIMCGTKGRAPVPIFVRPAIPIVQEPVIRRPTWFIWSWPSIWLHLVWQEDHSNRTWKSQVDSRLTSLDCLKESDAYSRQQNYYTSVFGRWIFILATRCLAILSIKRSCDGYSDHRPLGEYAAARMETHQRPSKADHMKSGKDKAISELRKRQSE